MVFYFKLRLLGLRIKFDKTEINYFNFFITFNFYLVRFKYFTFNTLNEHHDVFRIHQLYEQLKYSVLSGEFEISEDQALTLGSLQYFIDDYCVRNNIFDKDPALRSNDDTDGQSSTQDINDMLQALEMELEGTQLNQQGENFSF